MSPDETFEDKTSVYETSVWLDEMTVDETSVVKLLEHEM